MNTPRHVTRVSITNRQRTPQGDLLTIQAWCTTRNCGWESQPHQTIHPAQTAGQRHTNDTTVT